MSGSDEMIVMGIAPCVPCADLFVRTTKSDRTRIVAVLAFVLAGHGIPFAQSWNCATGYCITAGNVGIGTQSAPSYPFQVNTSAALLAPISSGSVGIGTAPQPGYVAYIQNGGGSAVTSGYLYASASNLNNSPASGSTAQVTGASGGVYWSGPAASPSGYAF